MSSLVTEQSVSDWCHSTQEAKIRNAGFLTASGISLWIVPYYWGYSFFLIFFAGKNSRSSGIFLLLIFFVGKNSRSSGIIFCFWFFAGNSSQSSGIFLLLIFFAGKNSRSSGIIFAFDFLLGRIPNRQGYFCFWYFLLGHSLTAHLEYFPTGISLISSFFALRALYSSVFAFKHL